jgi:hypothetical protein
MDRKGIASQGVNWFDLAQEDEWRALLKARMEFQAPKSGEILDQLRNYKLLRKD